MAPRTIDGARTATAAWLIIAACLAAAPARAASSRIGLFPADTPRRPTLTLAEALPIPAAESTAEPAFVPDPAALDTARRVERRLRMLRWHQALGYTALTLLTAQTIVGQLLWSGLQGYESTDALRTTHRILGYASFGAYATAAPLAIFAPSFTHWRAEYDTTDIHRGLAFVHGTGMALMPWFGLYIARLNARPNSDPQLVEALRMTHLVAGYTTWAALAGASLVIVLR
jgi:hypothetical protein